MLVDQHEREQALDVSRSFCVTAPAGSGKTELLTQRYLRLLATVDEPEQVLAVTFTRKARAEMKQRILRALELGAGAKPEAAYLETTWAAAREALARDQSLGWNLTQNTNRLRIQTIDSLNQAIAGESPLLSGFGSTPSAVDDANTLYLRVIPKLLQSLDDADSDLARALSQVLLVFNGDTDRFSNMLCDLLAKRDQWLHYVAAAGDKSLLAGLLKQSYDAWVETDLIAARSAIHSFAPAIIDCVSFAVKHGGDKGLAAIEAASDLPAATSDACEAWQALANFILTSGGEVRKTVNAKQGFPAKTSTKDKTEQQRYVQAKAAMIELLSELQAKPDLAAALRTVRLIPPAINQQQTSISNDILLVLKYASAHLSLVFAEAGECDHIQIALAAAEMLGDSDDPSPTQLRWTQRLRHILIDEFQDTSIIQNTILERLIALWPEAREINPEALRSLFVVGDGMQSIYRFRAANVGLFIQANEGSIGSETLSAISLRQNFRSDTALVEWFNHTFERSFPEFNNASVGAVPYNMATPSRQGNGLAAVQGFASEQAEAVAIAKTIESLQAEQAQHSIAILVRARNHLKPIMAALSERGISHQSNDIKYLRDIPQVADIINLTRWVLTPDDDIAFAAVLRAPWCGASLQELYTLRQLGGSAGLSFHTLLEHDDMPKRLMPTINLLQAAWQQRDRQTLANTVQGLWLGLGGQHCSGANLRYAEQYFAQLRENTDIVCADTLHKALARMFAKPEPNPKAVHLMTIHKSKGLEFDTVFLAGLGKGGKADTASMLEFAERIHDNRPASFLLAPWGKAAVDKQLRQYVKNLDKQASQHEMLRVLYVGATRAASRLHLSFVFSEDDKAEEFAIKTPVSNSMIRPIWDAIANQVVCSQTEADNPSNALLVPAALRMQRQTEPTHIDISAPEAMVDAEANSARLETAQTALGTILHQLIERLAMSRGRVSSHLRNYCAAQIQQSVHIQDKDSALQAVATLIKNVTTTELGQWVSLSDDGAYNEWPLTARNTDNSISRYVIDRSFVENDIRWIIDYKTSTAKPEQSLTDFLEQQEQQYRYQLAQYAYAVGHLRSHQFAQHGIKTALYFPLINVLHEVTLNTAR